MRFDGIEGRVAFVSGGARGIGRCIAETLRDQGARVASGDLAAPAVPGVLGVDRFGQAGSQPALYWAYDLSPEAIVTGALIALSERA